MSEVDLTEDFEAMAAAFKRQFRLDLVMEEFDGNNIIRVTDEQGSGDVKYLGTLRSNWLRRQAPKYGFRSIGHQLLPEVAGGAYEYTKSGVTEITEARIHEISVVDPDAGGTGHIEVVTDVPKTEDLYPGFHRPLDDEELEKEE